MTIKRRPLHDEFDKQEFMCLQLAPAPEDTDDNVDNPPSQFGDDPMEIVARREEAQGTPINHRRTVKHTF